MAGLTNTDPSSPPDYFATIMTLGHTSMADPPPPDGPRPTLAGVSQPARLHLVARTGHPDFLDFPWQQPLADWNDPRIIDVARGLSRHVVRFVSCERSGLRPQRDHAVTGRQGVRPLARVATKGLPAVEAVGVVRGRTDDTGEPLGAVLITLHLEFSLPYRWLFTGRGVPDLRSRLVDTLAVLLRAIASPRLLLG